MTPPNNSPKAQEVKAVKAWAILNVDGTLNANSIHALSQAKDDIERKGGKMIQVEIRPINSGSSPSAEEKNKALVKVVIALTNDLQRHLDWFNGLSAHQDKLLCKSYGEAVANWDEATKGFRKLDYQPTMDLLNSLSQQEKKI